MGATSATGVSGIGSAAQPGGGNKGSDNMSLGVANLIGPRVVGAGTITLSGTTGTVYFPTLVGTASQYVIMLSTSGATFAKWDTFTTASFGVTAANNAVVHWAIHKIGLWGSPTANLANT